MFSLFLDRINMWVSYVVLAVSLVAGTNAFSSGAPESACVDMVPKHPVPAQTTPPPYTITTSTKVCCMTIIKKLHDNILHDRLLTYFYKCKCNMYMREVK